MENQLSVNTRIYSIDIAKGILMFAVVLSHAWYANSDILGWFFAFSMPAFFFLSGYTYKPGKNYLVNMKKRVTGLLIPYAVFASICTCLYPLYIKLSKSFAMPGAFKMAWLSVLKVDSINMYMATPMWFLCALFTASIIFFAVVDITRDSLKKTIIACVLLIAVTMLIETVKKGVWPWFIDFAPYGAATMLIGAYMGGKGHFAKLSKKNALIGIICLAISEILNVYFWGSARTSVVQYIEGGAWYGVLTAFIIAITGSIGMLTIGSLIERIPVVSTVLKKIGENTIWILCIHYCLIMLIEMVIFNAGLLSNSISQVVSVQIFGYGYVYDKPMDIVIKTAVALFSIVVSMCYAMIHKKVKKGLKKK